MANSNRVLKIKILLFIDTAFFFLELISGLAVGSLALLADSFHVLNDVCSLIVALQALRLAQSTETSERYSFGWQRAEVLGALINGVFLLALCFSIGLEAIARFFQDVDHGHGGHSHSHSHGDVEAVTPKPQQVHSHSHSSSSHFHSHATPTDRTPLLASQSPPAPKSQLANTSVAETSRADSVDDLTDDEEADLIAEELFVHPGEFRENIVKAAQEVERGTSFRARALSTTSRHYSNDDHQHLHHQSSHGSGEEDHAHSADAPHVHGHDGAMNMHGVWLHVLGDALGNIGVISAGLFIWLTDYSWKMYSDPFISLVITCIIFNSALPLVKSASFILLQGVPSSVPLDQVRSAIAEVPGVLNVHELHVWSLSESKTVASVHVMTHSEDFVAVSKKVRRVMHKFGIHSSTIQPEIVEPKASSVPSHVTSSQAASIELESDACLNPCVEDTCASSACCPPPTK